MRVNSTVVVKVGSSVIADTHIGIDVAAIQKLAKSIEQYRSHGHRVVVIMSGAVAAGRIDISQLRSVSRSLHSRVLAAVGQPVLMSVCHEWFKAKNLRVAQLLVTREAFAHRSQFFAIRDTLFGLLNNGVVPILNDNDVLHQNDDADFSDNDQLAALIAGMLAADHVILLTDQDGVYRRFPPTVPTDFVDRVEFGSPEFDGLEPVVRRTGKGRGGMKAKLSAARLLGSIGIPMSIANGTGEIHIGKLVAGNRRATLFVPVVDRCVTGVQRWLTLGAVPNGRLVASEGAIAALHKSERRSLLAAGVIEHSGTFVAGDVVGIYDSNGSLKGVGITRIGAAELRRLAQKKGVVIVHADHCFAMASTGPR